MMFKGEAYQSIALFLFLTAIEYYCTIQLYIYSRTTVNSKSLISQTYSTGPRISYLYNANKSCLSQINL